MAKKAPSEGKKPKDWLKEQNLQLLDIRNGLISSVRGSTYELTADARSGNDPADRALDTQANEFISGRVEVDTNTLALVNAAIDRIAEGVYQQCSGCTGVIPQTRLNAIPYTSLCIKCQIEEEKRS